MRPLSDRTAKAGIEYSPIPSAPRAEADENRGRASAASLAAAALLAAGLAGLVVFQDLPRMPPPAVSTPAVTNTLPAPSLPAAADQPVSESPLPLLGDGQTILAVGALPEVPCVPQESASRPTTALPASAISAKVSLQSRAVANSGPVFGPGIAAQMRYQAPVVVSSTMHDSIAAMAAALGSGSSRCACRRSQRTVGSPQ